MKIQLKNIGILLLIYLLFLYGFLIGEYKIFPYKFLKNIISNKPQTDTSQNSSKFQYGRWAKLRDTEESPTNQKEAIKKISTLPYLKGYESAQDEFTGLTVYLPHKAYNGVTLYCSGHEPIVYLMDMKGNILHTWSTTFKKVWPDSLPFSIFKEHKQFIRRARVFPNGDLLCVFEYIGLVKLDKNSKVLWNYAEMNHHDIDISQDNYIYSLGHARGGILTRYPNFPFQGVDDEIIILTPEGKEVKKISIFDAFYQSEYANYLNFIVQSDFFHTNTVDIIEKSVARQYDIFKQGDVLVSLRNINSIAVIDIESGKVKWALNGMWHAQHQSEFLENGHIMLFDNKGGNKQSFYKFNKSRIIEFDPFTQQIYWEYTGENQKLFFSHWLGYNQRLPNGNTLITESTQGHIFEVTPHKEIVWEYYNPHRTGKNNELIATVMGAQRLDRNLLTFLKER